MTAAHNLSTIDSLRFSGYDGYEFEVYNHGTYGKGKLGVAQMIFSELDSDEVRSRTPGSVLIDEPLNRVGPYGTLFLLAADH
jgi:hypothetical protein